MNSIARSSLGVRAAAYAAAGPGAPPSKADAVLKLVKWILILVVLIVVAGLVGGAGSLRDRGEDLLNRGRDKAAAKVTKQGAAQLSRLEFVQARYGMSPSALRSLVGEPESETSTRVEGLDLECWYYGIVAASGSYQFCFSGGRLESKWRFER